MEIYIIAILKEERSGTEKYRLLDIDDNNKVLDIPKSVLINTLKLKKVKIENATLSNSGNIIGKYYTLQKLTITLNNNTIKHSYNGMIALKVINKVVKISDYCGNVVECSINKNLNIINKDGNTLLCKIVNKNRNSNNKINALNKDVLNTETIWTLADFTLYMESHNWTYTICDEAISEKNNNKAEYIDNEPKDYKELCIKDIDKKCTAIKIPKDIVKIKIFEETDMESVIIGPDVSNIAPRSSEKTIKIKQLIFQSYKSSDNNRCTIYGEGLYKLNITKRLILPKAGILSKSFQYCVIPKLDLTNNQISNITGSFNFSCINEISVNNQYVITNSFNNITISTYKECSLKINSESIDNSYNCIESFTEEMITVEFGEKVRSIDKSFNNGKGIINIKIDPNNLIIKKIQESFCGHTHLSEINLEGNSLQVLKLPIGNDNTTININNLETLSSILLRCIVDTPRIKFTGYINNIGVNAFMGNTGWKRDISNVKELMTGAFAYTLGLEVFDTKRIPLVTTLPLYAFEHCVNLHTVIIRKNIKRIDSNIFETKGENINVTPIKAVIVESHDIDIDKSAFKMQSLPLFYVTAKSSMHKFCIKAKYPFKLINSVDEIVDTIYNKSMPAKLSKFEVILQGTKFEYLLENEKYKLNIEYLYKIAQALEEDTTVCIGNIPVELDKTKFKYMDYAKHSNLKENLDSGIKSLNSVSTNIVNNVITNINEFNSTCNLITTLFDNNITMYNDEIINMINTEYKNDEIRYIYIDNEKSISVIGSLEGIMILFITIKNDIVFMTQIMLKYLKSKYMIFKNNISLDKIGSIKFKVSEHLIFEANTFNIKNNIFSNELKQGDIISENEMTINNTELPEILSKRVYENIVNKLLFIGTSVSVTKINKNSLNNIKVLYYCIESNKFIIVQVHKATEDVTDIGTELKLRKGIVIDTFYIKDIQSIKNINIYFEQWTKAKLATIDENEMKCIINKENMFDIEDNIEVCKLADYEYAYSNQGANELSLDITLAQMILKTDMVEKVNKSLNFYAKSDYKKEIYSIDNSDTSIIKFTSDKTRDCIIGIIQPDTLLSSTNVLYKSSMSLKMLLQVIRLIGIARNETNHNTSIRKITNNTIDISKFVVTYTVFSRNFKAYGIKFDLAVERITGYTFIIGEFWDSEFYNLFKFKKYSDASKFLLENIANNNDLREDLERLLDLVRLNKVAQVPKHYTTDSIMTNDFESYNNELLRLRNYITNGTPNGWLYKHEYVELFKQLAKQPIE